MNARIAILLVTLVLPGLAVVGVSSYWFNQDYAALIKAEKYVENLVVQTKVNDRQLQYAYHRTYIHRINVFADGTWGLLGGIIAAVGIHGIWSGEMREMRGMREMRECGECGERGEMGRWGKEN